MEAVAQVEALDALPTVLVLSGEGWHEGVIGIVASRIVERYHRPTVLLAVKDGMARGSGRSVPAYDLMDGLRTCDDLLTQYGGHRQAAGMSLRTDDIAEFALAARGARARSVLTEDDMRRLYAPDAVVRGEDLTLDTVDALEALAPFGMGNPRVQLLALDTLLDGPELTRTGEHLRCTVVVDGVRTRGIGFRFADKMPALERNGYRAHAGLRLQASEWQGRERCEVQLHSLYAAPDLGAAALGCSPDCPFLDPLDLSGSCPGVCRALCHVHGREPAAGQRSARSRRATVGAGPDPLDRRADRGGGRLGDPSGAGTRRPCPWTHLGVTGLRCGSRLCWRTHMAPPRIGDVVVLDWAAAERRADLSEGRAHVIVAEPPYLPSHLAWLRERVSGVSRPSRLRRRSARGGGPHTAPPRPPAVLDGRAVPDLA